MALILQVEVRKTNKTLSHHVQFPPAVVLFYFRYLKLAEGFQILALGTGICRVNFKA